MQSLPQEPRAREPIRLASTRDMEATRDPALRARISRAHAGKIPGETPETVMEAYQLARAGKCRLIVRIDGRNYTARIRTPAGRPRRVELKNDRGAVYTVTAADGPAAPPACTCPDNAQRGARCKHIGTCTALGLI